MATNPNGVRARRHYPRSPDPHPASLPGIISRHPNITRTGRSNDVWLQWCRRRLGDDNLARWSRGRRALDINDTPLNTPGQQWQRCNRQYQTWIEKVFHIQSFGRAVLKACSSTFVIGNEDLAEARDGKGRFPEPSLLVLWNRAAENTRIGRPERCVTPEALRRADAAMRRDAPLGQR